MDEWQQWFERVWEFREEQLYPSIFGSQSADGIYVLTYERFKERLGVEQADPRWMNHGVLRFPPSADANTWRFVTSGLSNAWEDDSPDPAAISGLGVEFVLETLSEEPWALQTTLNILAYQLALAAGHFGDARVIGPYHRIPLNGPIDGRESALTYVFVSPAVPEWQDLKLESGMFSLLHLVGITATEAQFARDSGSEALIDLMESETEFPVTDASRTSVR